MVGQPADVGRKLIEIVAGGAVRLVAEVVAPLVRRNHVVPAFRQRYDLVPPPVPEFGKAV